MCDTLSKSNINFTLTKLNYETPSKYEFIFSQTEPDNGHTESINVQDLTIESERLKTFKNWNDEKITPEKLANIGFYSNSTTDNKVKCAFCHVEMSLSTLGDDPLADHLSSSPNCPLARGKKGQNHLSTFLQNLPPDHDVCGNVDTFTDSFKFLRKIMHPFEDITTRVESFENWPESSKQNPEKLAEAGFYYKGVDDKTVCFECSGPLSNWEDDDDPWEQHALWFPKCKFLLNTKGEEFVHEVRKKLKNYVPSGWDLPNGKTEVCKDGGSFSTVDDDKMCLICCNNQREVIFIPCGHDWTCLRCMESLEDKKCPVCREQIINVKKF